MDGPTRLRGGFSIGQDPSHTNVEVAQGDSNFIHESVCFVQSVSLTKRLDDDETSNETLDKIYNSDETPT